MSFVFALSDLGVQGRQCFRLIGLTGYEFAVILALSAEIHESAMEMEIRFSIHTQILGKREDHGFVFQMQQNLPVSEYLVDLIAISGFEACRDKLQDQL